MKSSKLPDLSPLFYAINPDNLSGIELFLRRRRPVDRQKLLVGSRILFGFH
jgi:hypothetical protein